MVQTLTADPWQEMMYSRKDSLAFHQKVSVVKKMAMTDLNTAIDYVRKHANELKVDPTRIGLMGFSAGGTLAANVAYNFTAEARPDFIAPIYSVITTIEKSGVKQDAPPLFIAAATDDQLVSNSINLYNDWMNAKRSVELHIYSKGGHGLTGSAASSTWIIRFEEWLVTQGLLKSIH